MAATRSVGHSSLKDKFQLYTIDDVVELFDGVSLPRGVKAADLIERIVRSTGSFRELKDPESDAAGAIILTHDDVAHLVEHIRAQTADSMPSSLVEGLGLLGGRLPVPDAVGYITVITDPLDKLAAVYIGWAPVGRVNDLVRLLEVGYPGALRVVHSQAGTPRQCDALRRRLGNSRLPGTESWFASGDLVNDVLLEFRDKEVKTDGTDERGA